jgi:hypothetical protein
MPCCTQAFELHRPLPVAGTARTVSTVTGIYDKGPSSSRKAL